MHRIRELREEKGLTQVRLAVAADMNPATLNRIEMGKANPNLKTLERLADALDITVSRLLEDDSPKDLAPQLPLENGAAEDRGLRYLKAWRFFVWRLEDRWQKEPPASRGEVAVVLDVMKSLIDEGAFDHPLGDAAGVGSDADRNEQFERNLLFMGIKKLNEIADDVEADEEADQRRSKLEVIEGRMAG